MATLTAQDILTAAARLPAAPQTLAELSELLEDPVADIRDVARLVRRDAPMAAEILRVSNSVGYGGGGVGSIEEAVSRVGFGEVHRVVGCAVTGLLADRELTFYRVPAETLRDHMVCTGLACEILARGTDFHERHGYTAGLLRPLGIMVLDRLMRGPGQNVDLYDPAREAAYGPWERRFSPLGNADVTALLLEHARFAPDVVEAVRGHALPPELGARSMGADILHVACAVIEEIGLGLPGERGLWSASTERLERAELSAERVRACVAEITGRLETVRQSLR